MRRAGLAAAALALVSGTAQAAGKCNAPYAPILEVGRSPTPQDIEALRKDVLSFIKASDIYQACLAAQKKDAFIPSSQAKKERVAREFNAILRALKAAPTG